MCAIDEWASKAVPNYMNVISPETKLRASCEQQFQASSNSEETDENDICDCIENEFDKNEWVW